MLANRYVQRSLAIHPTVHIGVLRVELVKSHHIQQTDVFHSLECLIYKVCFHSQWRYLNKNEFPPPQNDTPPPPRGAKGIRDDPKDLPSYFFYNINMDYLLLLRNTSMLPVKNIYSDWKLYIIILWCISVPRWRFQPIWRILVNLDHFPKDRGENKQYLKPPPRYIVGTKQTHLMGTILETPNHWLFTDNHWKYRRFPAYHRCDLANMSKKHLAGTQYP